MQLADQKQSDRDELEPILYAALINSMVQNFWAIFLGSASAAVAAVMTALKTGDVWLWPLAFLLIAIGTARAFQMRGYENRTRPLSFEEAKHLEPRYWIGALSYAAVLGDGETLEVVMAGKIIHDARSDADLPAVGDWVALEIREDPQIRSKPHWNILL